MRKLFGIILTIILLSMLTVPSTLAVSAASEELIASENVTLQSSGAAYSGNLRVKNQQGATERVSFIKFDYSEYNIDEMAEIDLNLFVKLVSGTGQEDLNKVRLYWSADTSWSEMETAIKYDAAAAYNNMIEIGDNLIQIVKLTSQSNDQKYYSYDVTDAIKANMALGKTSITFILKQDRITNSQGGLDFAARSESGHEPKLTFCEIAKGSRLIASENVTLQNNSSAYTASSNLRVKNQQGATERVSFIKFEYAGYNVNDTDVIALNLYTKETAGVGREEINSIRLYWSADTSWRAENNTVNYSAVSAYNDKTEIGDNIIEIPYMSSAAQQYYSYDVTEAVKTNAAAGNNSITFILKQDKITSSNGGIDFAAIGQAGYEPNLTFKDKAFSAEAPTITESGTDDVITANAYIENTTQETKSAVIYLASYKGNLLTGVSLQKADFIKNNTGNIETELTPAQDFDSVKAFVWEYGSQSSICLME